MSRSTIALVQRTAATPWAAELSRAGYDLRRFPDASALLRGAAPVPPGLVVLSDMAGGTWGAIEAARTCKARWSAPVVVIAADSSEASAIAALKAGVNDYLKAPVLPDQLVAVVLRLLGRGRRPHPSRRDLRPLVGDSPALRSAVDYASRVALTNSTVLVTGETGTGKELAAELIHSLSARAGKPFVAFNCAAIPDSLLESELFGRERGAYTGADTAYDGKLKFADGGTVFFDEIGDLSPFGQAKLLRVLESRQVQRLGSSTDIPLDIRIIAATNQDLGRLVDGGGFRRDLYFRLRVTRVDLPALRSRREDVAVLLDYFGNSFAQEIGRPFPGFSTRALRILTAFDWPGNVRQLRNVVEELFVRLPDRPVDVDDLPIEITGHDPRLVFETVDERTRIVAALTSTRWNKKRAAERLCWSRMTLYRKMAFYSIAAADAAAAPDARVKVEA